MIAKTKCHLGLASLAGALLLNASAIAGPATLTTKPCRIDAGFVMSTSKAECATISVALDPSNPDGEQIELHLAVVPALNVNPLNDPLVFLAGGPGQSAIDGYLSMRGAFEAIRRDRPILLLDQRGTGRSSMLSCQTPSEEDMQNIEDPAVIERLTKDCIAALPADPRFFTTSVAVKDLDLVREALGYEQLNLWGGSYGSRVALHYLRRYPQHTRRVIIDGVLPADLVLGPGMAIDAQMTLDAVFAACAEDAMCTEAHGNLAEKFALVHDTLGKETVTLQIKHPTSGEPTSASVNEETLAGVVRLSSYAPATRALLPLMISQAAQGDYAMMAAQGLLIFESLSEAIAGGMHNAVVCSEDAPMYEGLVFDKDKLLASYIGTSQFDALREICKHWPKGVVDDDFKTSVVSDHPVLLLSGELDPVTPPAYAEQAAKTLPNSAHIIAPSQGHIISGLGCVPKLIGEFIDGTAAADLDASCVQRLGPTAVFLTPAGPAP